MSATAVMCPLPVREAVRDLLADLLGREAVVERAAERLTLASAAPLKAAVFAFDGGRVAATALCDLSFSPTAGAGLAQLPESAASDALQSRNLGRDLREFLYEVLSVLSRLLNWSATPHMGSARCTWCRGSNCRVTPRLCCPTRRQRNTRTSPSPDTGRAGLPGEGLQAAAQAARLACVGGGEGS